MASSARTKKTSAPGVYRRGDKYLYTYRAEGRQRWGTAASLDEARRCKRRAEADADRGEFRDLGRVRFGEFALDWIATYPGRTSAGFPRVHPPQLPTDAHRPGDPLLRGRATIVSRRNPAARCQGVRALADRAGGPATTRTTPVEVHHPTARRRAAGATRRCDGGRCDPHQSRGWGSDFSAGGGRHRPRARSRAARAIDRRAAETANGVAGRRAPGLRTAHTHGAPHRRGARLRWGRDLILTGTAYVRVRWQFADGRVCEPKTRYGKRDIPLAHGLARKLVAAQPPGADGKLAFTTAAGTRLNRHNLYRDVLGPAARRAGLEWVTLHTLRHTCASLLFAPVEHGGGGKNVKQVQEWLGHHSPAYTLREYVHLIDSGVGDANFLDAVTAK